MRRILSVVIVVSLFAGVLLAQGVGRRGVVWQDAVSNSQVERPSKAGQPEQPRKRKVDFMADLVKPYNKGGDSVVYFIGNFAAHHNGAVIWCDSAVRYSDTKWGFFHRMVINQDSIFIYGDSAIYDGDAARAEIYAPIVKVVDGDALLYTYNFSFNTQTKVGEFSGGGVLVHDNNILESIRGYYDADKHNIICVESVELHGADYDMKSDSVIYNTDTELARFFTSTEIWNADGEYLSADEGFYDKALDLYKITREGYILSQEQEMWGDTMEYYRTREHIIARSNIQMDDFKNKVMAFGDYAEYWTQDGKALLTRRPSAMGYDTTQSDTVYVSADSVWMFTIDPQREARLKAQALADSLAARRIADSLAMAQMQNLQQNDALRQNNVVSQDLSQGLSMEELMARHMRGQNMYKDEAQVQAEAQTKALEEYRSLIDTAQVEPDTLQHEVVELVDSALLKLQDSISKLPAKQQKAYYAAEAKRKAAEAKEEHQRLKAQAKKIKLDSIAKLRQAKINIQLEKERQAELKRIAQDSVRRAERRAKLVAKGKDVSQLDIEDSLAKVRNERILSQMKVDSLPTDSLTNGQQLADSLAKDSLAIDSLFADSIHVDSTYRLLKAYRRVKMWREDAQMVCDSLVSNSRDSIIRLYIEPVMWNQNNQLASTQVDVYTKNGALERAEFAGEPIMVAEIDTAYYNQVAGKTMTAFFKDNEIFRNDVDGNVQTIYFRTESEESTLVTEMTYLESASASFFIEDQQLVGITYRNDVPFTMYPLALIPESQPTKLDNFKWVPQLRPTKEDVFNRMVRPTQREERWQRRRPTFSIVERMDRRKELLLMRGEWSDREDQLTPELIEWRDRNMKN